MTTSTDLTHLITLPDDKTERLAIFTAPAGAGVQPWLDQITAQVEAFGMGDASTEQGREDMRSLAFKVTKAKTLIEKTGKDLKDDQVKIPKLIDVARNHAFDTLEKLAKKVRAPLTEWEEQEERRREEHNVAITTVATLADTMGTSDEIRAALDQARATPVDEETCQEFAPEYEHARDLAVRTLEKKLQEQEKVEADRAELEQLRAAQIERDQAAELDRMVAMERQREADAARLREEHAAEAVRIADERRVAEAAEAEARRVRDVREAEAAAERKIAEADAARRAEAERVRLQAEATQRENERRAADREHRGAVNRIAVAALMENGMSEPNARRAVELIAQRKVPAVSIAY